MVVPEASLKGVKRRKPFGQVYVEVRYHEVKLYCTKIESPEEGALFYDLVQLHRELERVGEKRKAVVKLNYPAYSRSLQSLPSNLDIRFRKEEATEIILKQARAAAKNLPESLRCSTPVLGSPIPSYPSLSHQNVHGEPLAVKQDLSGPCSIQSSLLKISELSRECNVSFTALMFERLTLERKVAGIDKNSGLVSFQEHDPNKTIEFMTQLKTMHQKNSEILDAAEEGCKSLDIECLKLRKVLEDHNNTVLAEGLNVNAEMLGRQRAAAEEWPPRVHGPIENQNECGEGHGPPWNPDDCISSPNEEFQPSLLLVEEFLSEEIWASTLQERFSPKRFGQGGRVF